VLLFSLSAQAHKINFDAGFYSIKADPPAGSGQGSISLSGPGTYSLGVSVALAPSWEISAGYTVFFSKFLQGDMGFGPDFSVNFFPFTRADVLKSEGEGVQYMEIEKWRPFVDVAFHQRQFQSVQSAFSGFGFGAGVEYQYSRAVSIRGQVRSMNLSGPSAAKFNYMDVLAGLQLHF
jgi:hypothetical protein